MTAKVISVKIYNIAQYSKYIMYIINEMYLSIK